MVGYRKNRRFPVMCKSEYTHKELYIIEMSLEGMKIRTTFVFDKKTDISLTLVLPSLDIIKVNCDIVWEDIDENRNYIYGVHLNEFNSKHKETYVTYINSLGDVITPKSYQYS